MLKLTRLSTFATLGMLCWSLGSATGQAQEILSTAGWEYAEHRVALDAAGSPYSRNAAIEHHSLEITVRPNMVNMLTFGASCTFQSSTPFFELRVPTLDIRLYDSFNDTVFVRFLVKGKKMEHSLLGELLGRNRIIFRPLTRAQEKSMLLLFQEMSQGEQISIGLLQGQTMKPRVYKIPLSGFSAYAPKLISACQQHFLPEQQLDYKPDYVSCEPTNYAPKGFSLVPKPKNSYVTMPEVKEEETTIIKEEKEEETNNGQLPEIIPFTPGGGPVSIGPDGKPIGVDTAKAAKPEQENIAFGQAQGPMRIGEDGRPLTSEPKDDSAEIKNAEPDSEQIDIF